MGRDRPVSRRDFLSFFSGLGMEDDNGEAKPGLDLPIPGAPPPRSNAIPLHRPPGAVEENLFLDRCTRCGECAKACPHDAIIEASPRMRHAAATPTINAAIAPCYLCDELPCVAACPEEALLPGIPPRMGTASIKQVDCLAYQKQFCTVCYEHCPVEGAITLDNGKPTIHADVCTGCGICVHVCPAPMNAVLYVPALMRPDAPEGES